MRYEDVTNNYYIKKQYKLEKQYYFIDEKGVKYLVDGKHVVLEPTQKEIEVAKLLGQTFGGEINVIPRVNNPEGIKTPDYILNGQRFDLKEIKGKGKNTIDTAIKSKREQASNFILDITEKCKLKDEEIIKQIEKIYNSKNREWLEMVVVKRNDKLIKIYKRK